MKRLLIAVPGDGHFDADRTTGRVRRTGDC